MKSHLIQCVVMVYFILFYFIFFVLDLYFPLSLCIAVHCALNPFTPGDFAKKRVLKLVEWFSGHCHAIKS